VGSIAEVGYVFQERHQGKSKVTSKQYVDYLHHLVRLRLLLGGLDDSVSVWIPSWSVHPLWFSGSIGGICRYGAAVLLVTRQRWVGP